MRSEGNGGAGSRRRGLESVRAAITAQRRVVLTTHVNADGDGAGSEVAIAHFLRRRGGDPVIVNPTPFPPLYRFMLEDLAAHTVSDEEGRRALERAQLILVLDTAERSRLGAVAGHLESVPVAVLDHHPPTGDAFGGPAVRDPTACATGELVYELLTLEGDGISPADAEALYVAIATDTGSFSFSNTTARAHEIAARLIEAGVETGRIYRQLHAQTTPEGLALLELALSRLRIDPELPISWIALRKADVARTRATSEDMDGLVEYPRRLRGIEVAIMLRELGRDRTKASLRSNGEANVAAVAISLGGGGHEKAAGVLLNLGLEEATTAVLEAVRHAVRAEVPT